MHIDCDGMDSVTEAGFDVYAVTFPQARLERLAALLDQPAPRGGEVRKLHTIDAGRLRRACSEVFLLLRQRSLPASVSVGINIKYLAETVSELQLAVLKAWGGSSSVRQLATSTRTRVLRRAMDFIESHSMDVFTVEELCRQSACSLSTLERAFREHFGVSPKRYIQVVRLAGLRRVLLDPDDCRNIGDIAMDWGFWHMSQLAVSYYKTFGELPSETRTRCAPVRPSLQTDGKLIASIQ